jgi:SAM-dependent methyltransferase
MNAETDSVESYVARSTAHGAWTCPVCDQAQQRRRIAEIIWRTEIPGPTHYDIVRCSNCDVVATDPMPSRGVLDAYYASYAPTAIDEYRETKLVSMQAPLWSYLRGFVRTQGKPSILDYGFGAGAFLKHVSATGGVRAFGTDFSEQNLGQLRQWSAASGVPIETFNAGAGRVPEFVTERMDLITMFQVVEHLVDPVAVIRDLGSVQNAGGLLYIECPHQDAWFFRAKNHFRRLLSREFMYGSVSPPQHVLGFNRRSLTALLERCGYRTLEVGDYSVADGVHAPETVAWYPTPWEWLTHPEKRTPLGFGKAIIRVIDVPLSRMFGVGGGLFALAVRV